MRYLYLFSCFFLLFLTLFLPNWHTSSYLSCLLPETCNKSEIDTIKVNVKKLSKEQAFGLFGRTGLMRKRKPIYPLILTIENKSHKKIIVDPAHISIKLVDPKIAAARLHAHTSRRIVGTVLVGLSTATVALFAAAYITIIGTIGMIPALVKTGYAALGASTIFVVGTPYIAYNQAQSAQSINESINTDILSKSLYKSREIEPGQKVDLLLFAHYSLRKQPFGITLFNEDQKEFSFTIDLKDGVTC